jgi:AraC-like DNA-binding protein
VRGFVLSEDYVRTNLADQIPQFIKNPRLSFSLTLALEDVEAIDYYLKGFIRLSRLAHNPESNIYKSLFSSLLYFIDSLRGDKHPDAGSEIKAEVRLVDAFLLMVCDNKQRKNNIDYYASQLFVSCNYLCTSVKRETGETVKSWIDRSLINNIKFQLKYTNNGLKSISHDFGFESLSAFCKFFKRMEGMTANDYRSRLSPR